MAQKVDNIFVQKFIPNDLKWYERGGLDTWYLEGKCKDFLENTDRHFEQMKIINFYILSVSKKGLKQYQQTDHQMVMSYPAKERKEIFSSIFRNVGRNDMNVTKESVNKHFKNKKKQVLVELDSLKR